MATVRAKIRVQEIQRHFVPGREQNGEKQTVVMFPVYADDNNPENKQFWDATPGGKIELNFINVEAAKRFELGKEYYVDFTPAS